MVEIKRYDLSLMKGGVSRRSPNRVLMTTQLGYYTKNEWTEWADRRLLKSPKFLEFLKGSEYSFWLKWFSDWIKSDMGVVDPLIQHIPYVSKNIGMKPIWAMSFAEKRLSCTPWTGVSWRPKFFRTEHPMQCEEALQSIGLDKCSVVEPFRIERECFPNIEKPVDKLEPIFVERIYNGDRKMLVFSVITGMNNGDRWLLRCGNQEVVDEGWKTDFSLQLPEIGTDNLYIEQRFAQVTQRLLRIKKPFIVEISDSRSIRHFGYDTQAI